MANKKKKEIVYSGKTMLNSHGNEIAIELVDKQALRREATINKIFSQIERLNAQMFKAKAKIYAQIIGYNEHLAKKKGVKPRGSNIQLTDYAGTRRVAIKNSSINTFNELISIAETKIKNYVKRLSADSKPELEAIINNVFKTDKKGFLDKNKILSLREIIINDPEWKEAMDLINESLEVRETKEYLNIQKKSADGSWKNIDLNFSSISIEDETHE